MIVETRHVISFSGGITLLRRKFGSGWGRGACFPEKEDLKNHFPTIYVFRLIEGLKPTNVQLRLSTVEFPYPTGKNLSSISCIPHLKKKAKSRVPQNPLGPLLCVIVTLFWVSLPERSWKIAMRFGTGVRGGKSRSRTEKPMDGNIANEQTIEPIGSYLRNMVSGDRIHSVSGKCNSSYNLACQMNAKNLIDPWWNRQPLQHCGQFDARLI